jgi:Family of unknown function (DUF6290)
VTQARKDDFRPTVRFDEDDRKLLEKLVARLKLKMSDIIRQAVREKAEREGIRA